MKVILRQNIDSLGKVGDVVNVSEGYALNYLIPKKYAYAALKGNVTALEEEKRLIEKKRQKEVKAAQEIASKLSDVRVSLTVQVGEDDRLFGSVTSQMIADALTEKGFDLDKRKIELDEPIKTLGIYDVNVRLHAQVAAPIKVWVVKE
ncbi:MAG: 50S ribosomal protein L9 [Ignavibacteriaceae bacterium]|nr:50S ribosomal protein L9 [Ignavibacteriaceae bacterium]NUM71943.1 50S ribosomal protein L9 [Ignavibacteriaceae bacterium]